MSPENSKNVSTQSLAYQKKLAGKCGWGHKAELKYGDVTIGGVVVCRPCEKPAMRAFRKNPKYWKRKTGVKKGG